MNSKILKKHLGNVDIYVLDQWMKNNYSKTDIILDAGCGTGRNLTFFHKLGYVIFGCDSDSKSIITLQKSFPSINLTVANLTNLPYSNSSFNHIICNAVLHFAESESEFLTMIKELHRILKPNGSLLIRMTSEFGIEELIKPANNQFLLPDGTHRLLLNVKLLNKITKYFTLKEPLKTVNVNNLRCMTTLILEKK